MPSIEEIKKFWEETGVSLSEAKKALVTANGDSAKAKELLTAWGAKVANKKSDRETKSGVIDSYVHSNGKSGVLVDVRCETDFVAKSPEFKTLVHELALHIAAVKPLYVSEEQIPAEVVDGETKIYTEQAQGSGKPAEIVTQIIEGKLKKYKADISLLSQAWVKDDTKTIKTLIEDAVAKLGEKIEVKRFAHFEI